MEMVMGEVTRAEHLEWCKTRAREYLDAGDVANAMVSMLSDLGKHDGTESSARMGAVLMLAVDQTDIGSVRRWVEGFN